MIFIYSFKSIMYLGQTFWPDGPQQDRAINSVGECHPHTVEVRGSNPRSPTRLKIKGFPKIRKSLFSLKIGLIFPQVSRRLFV